MIVRTIKLPSKCIKIFKLCASGCAGSALLRGDDSLLLCVGSPLWCLFLLRSTDSRARGLQHLQHADLSHADLGHAALALAAFRPITGSVQALGCADFSSCGAPAELLRSMWDLSKPAIEPASAELAGGFPSTVTLEQS